MYIIKTILHQNLSTVVGQIAVGCATMPDLNRTQGTPETIVQWLVMCRIKTGHLNYVASQGTVVRAH